MLKNNFSITSKILMLCVTCIALNACDSDRSHEKLQEYIKTVKTRDMHEVEDIPQLKSYKRFDYPNKKRRNPFTPIVKRSVNTGTGPDQRRPKQALESFALDSLRMVGTVHQGPVVWAIISAPNDAVYKVKVGDFIGQNYGKIKAIKNNEVELIETVPSNDGWEKRSAKLALSKGE